MWYRWVFVVFFRSWVVGLVGSVFSVFAVGLTNQFYDESIQLRVRCNTSTGCIYLMYDDHSLSVSVQSGIATRYVLGEAKGKIASISLARDAQTHSVQTRWIATDYHGSEVASLAASGSLERSLKTAFGELITDPEGCEGEVYTDRHSLDETSCLYNFHARFYDAQSGRFISTDPVHPDQNLNWYTYVDNNPVTYVDPTGMFKAPFQYYDDWALFRDRVLTDLARSTDGNESAWELFKKAGLTYQLIATDGLMSTLNLAKNSDEGRYVDDAVIVGGAALGGGISILGRRSGAGFNTRLSTNMAELGNIINTTKTPLEAVRFAMKSASGLKGGHHEKSTYLHQALDMIVDHYPDHWSFKRIEGVDGSAIFKGVFGDSIVVSPEGRIFRGSTSWGDGAPARQPNIVRNEEGFVPVYEDMTAL